MSINRNRYLLAGAPAVVALLLVVIAVFNARSLRRAIDQVSHTTGVIDVSERVLMRALDSETSQRGYLLTRDSQFLGPSIRAREDVNAAVASLRELTSDNPDQAPRIDSLQREIEHRFAMLDKLIVLRDARPNQPVPVESLTVGRRHMDGIRRWVGEIRADEERTLEGRNREQSAQSQFAMIVLILGGVIVVLVAAMVNAHLTGIIVERERMAAELTAQLGDLEAMRRQLSARPQAKS